VNQLHLLIAAALVVSDLHAAEAVLDLFRDRDAPALRIWGSRKYDWFLEASPDLLTWSALPDQPPLLANRTNQPVRRLPAPPAPGGQFYRAARPKASTTCPCCARSASPSHRPTGRRS